MSTTPEQQLVERSLFSEDYPLSPVPMHARKPIWSIPGGKHEEAFLNAVN